MSDAKTLYFCTNRDQHNRIVLGTWNAEYPVLVWHAQRDPRNEGGWGKLGYDLNCSPILSVTPEMINNMEKREVSDSHRGWLEFDSRSATAHFRCPKCRRHRPIKIERLNAALSAGLTEADISRM